MKYYVYILYSEEADRYYIGQTSDLSARLTDHNSGDRPTQNTKYTFKHRPWKLMCSFCVGEERGTAIKVERYIKRQKDRKFIEKLIQACGQPQKFAQLLRVPVNRD